MSGRVQYHCLTCNAVVLPNEVARAVYETNRTTIPDGSAGIWTENILTVLLCPTCSAPFIVHAERICDSDAEEFSEFSERLLYPSSRVVDLSTSPDAVSRAYRQAALAFQTSSYDACVIMARKTVECICKHYGAKGKLVDAIKELKRRKVIDDMLEQWFDMVHDLGNRAVHESDSAFSVDEAQDCLRFTEAIIEYVFNFYPKYLKYIERKKA